MKKKVIIELEVDHGISDQRIEGMINESLSKDTINWLYDMKASEVVKIDIYPIEDET